MAKWRVQSTEPRNDGSGDVAFDVWGLDDTNNIIPGKHMTVLLDQADISTATATGTTAQKKANMKSLIAAKLPPEWLNTALNAEVAANAAAVVAKTKIDTLVNNTYPVDFTL